MVKQTVELLMSTAYPEMESGAWASMFCTIQARRPSPPDTCDGGAGISLFEVTDASVRQGSRPSSVGWSMFAPRLRGDGTVARRAWRSAYVRRAVVADVACAGVGALVGYLVRFGSVAATTEPRPSLWGLLLLPAVWAAAMLVARCYEERFLWVGPEEFRRV